LQTIGIFISSGKVSEIIHSQIGQMQAEKTEIYEAGLRSTLWLRGYPTNAAGNSA
jgi:hypothetical protein